VTVKSGLIEFSLPSRNGYFLTKKEKR
jgi:hypothetical protein